MNLFFMYAKTKLLEVITKVNLKDIADYSKEAVEKANKKVKEIVKVKKEKGKSKEWQKKFPLSFFYGSGKFQPIYFWIFIFCSLASAMLFIKLYVAWDSFKKGTYNNETISTADIATVLTFVSSLVLLYNNNKKSKPIKDEPFIEKAN